MITVQQLAQSLATLGYPLTYYEFDDDVELSFPCLTYQETGSINFGADNKVFKKVKNYSIELYTEKKDLKVEKEVEDLLDSLSIFYETDDAYIESERLFQRTYYITLK